MEHNANALSQPPPQFSKAQQYLNQGLNNRGLDPGGRNGKLVLKAESTTVSQEKTVNHDEVIQQLTDVYGPKTNPKVLSIDNENQLDVGLQTLAHKIYHAGVYNVHPELYGMSESDLKTIEAEGLVAYLEYGVKLPSKELLNAYFQGIKSYYERNKVSLNDRAAFRSDHSRVVSDKIDACGPVLIFNSDGRLISPSCLKLNQAAWYRKTGSIGKKDIVIPKGTAPAKIFGSDFGTAKD